MNEDDLKAELALGQQGPFLDPEFLKACAETGRRWRFRQWFENALKLTGGNNGTA